MGRLMLDYRVRTFLEAYRTHSFTGAARELHITQPAVSQHIRYLEQRYGTRLFSKTTRGADPTPAADILYWTLSAMANDEQRLYAELHSLEETGSARTPLRLGCTRTIADYVAPRLVASHAVSHPHDPISLRVGNTTELVELMDAGEIDVALVEGSFDHAAFESEVMSTEPYIAVATPALTTGIRGSAEAAGAPTACAPATGTQTSGAPDQTSGAPATGTQTSGAPASGKGIESPAVGTQRPRSIRELLGFRLILREAGSGTREILERHLSTFDLSIDDFAGSSVELASIPAIIACVKAGAGISFLYRIAVERELACGELVDITPADFAINHDFSLIWQRGSNYAGRFRALLDTWQRALRP